MPENKDVLELWDIVSSQWRCAFAGLIGLDMPAVFTIAEKMDIEINPAMVRKIKCLENVVLDWQKTR